MLDQSCSTQCQHSVKHRTLKCSAAEHAERKSSVMSTVTRILLLDSVYQVKPRLGQMTCINTPVCPAGIHAWSKLLPSNQIVIRPYSDMCCNIAKMLLLEFRNFNCLFLICILYLFCASYGRLPLLSHSCSWFHLKCVCMRQGEEQTFKST